MSIVVLDTDVPSAGLRDELPNYLRRQLAGHALSITFVTAGS